MSQNMLFAFPGQGSQAVGMGAEFVAHESTKHIFEMANDALGFDITKLMLEGELAELTLTANTQPALVTVSYAAFEYLQNASGKGVEDLCAMVAGHSLGEYAALAVAGVITFEQAVKLVRIRGEAMQKAVPAGEGAMAAVLGLTFADVEAVAKQAGCFVANDNSEGQVVISGAKAAVESAAELAKEKGAKRALMLPVSAPFHCPMMQPAAEVMQAALAEVEFQTPKVPVICNVTAKAVTNQEELKQNLVTQVTGSVLWRESMVHSAENGINEIVELGSGKVLTGLAKRCDDRLVGVNLNTPAMIDEFLNK